ncbi:MAG: exodeoxyribonuclease III [Gammaproteobacteria bacterium]
MKIVSFNINGVRARLHQVAAVIESHQPDVIGLQETKVADEAFPLAALESLGYHVAFHGQKGHYGVALMTRLPPEWVVKGFPGDAPDAQRRFIGCAVTQSNGKLLCVFNGYFPQGESEDHPVKYPAKQAYYADLTAYLKQNLGDDHDFVLLGDVHVAPTERDVGLGLENARRWLRTGKCSFLPEERTWFQGIERLGLVDTFRYCQPEAELFSWFDYRSRGFEQNPKRGLSIDLIMVNQPLLARCQQAGIDHAIRAMDKPSDHCPVWAEFSESSVFD